MSTPVAHSFVNLMTAFAASNTVRNSGKLSRPLCIRCSKVCRHPGDCRRLKNKASAATAHRQARGRRAPTAVRHAPFSTRVLCGPTQPRQASHSTTRCATQVHVVCRFGPVSATVSTPPRRGRLVRLGQFKNTCETTHTNSQKLTLTRTHSQRGAYGAIMR